MGPAAHAKVILNILDLMYVDVAAILDDREELDGQTLLNRPVFYAPEALPDLQWKGITKGIVAYRKPTASGRKSRIIIEGMGFTLITAVHPSTVIDPTVQIGEGSVVMAGVIVNSSAVIGRNVVLNTGCTVDHDCWVGDYVHISPGVHLGGSVTVGMLTQNWHWRFRSAQY